VNVQPNASLGPDVSGSSAPSARRRGNPVPYDFRRPTKLSREHARALEVAYDTFARQWSTLLSSSLRVLVSVEPVRVEQRTYDEYVSGLPSPTTMAMFAPEPFAGAGVLQWPMELSLVQIDHLLGGRGGPQPERGLTEIESELIRGLLERVLSELRYALTGLVNLTPRLTGLESNPQFVQAAAASDLLAVAGFTVRIGNVEGLATLALPMPAVTPKSVDPVTDRSTETAARAQTRRAITNSVQEVAIEVAARLTPTRLTSADIMQLAVGDVVRFPHPVSRPLDLVAGESVCGAVTLGQHGARVACLVVSSRKSIA
jgi:flagellar motor switch protein FliM